MGEVIVLVAVALSIYTIIDIVVTLRKAWKETDA